MKKRLVYVSFFMLFVICLNYVSSYPVHAASSSSTVNFSSLPSDVQDEFMKIVETLLDSVFSSTDTHTITLQGEDGKTYKYDYTSFWDRMQATIDGNEDFLQAEITEEANVPESVELVINSVALSGLSILYTPLFLLVIQNAVDLFNRSTHFSSTGGEHGGSGRSRAISASDYSAAVDNILNGIYVNQDIYDGVTHIIDFFKGVPKNSYKFESDYKLSVFDNLGLTYSAFNNINDVFWDYNINVNNYFASNDHYTIYFIDNYDNLYTLENLYTGSKSYLGEKILYFAHSGLSTINLSAYAYQQRNSFLNFGLRYDNNNLYLILSSSRYTPTLEYLYTQYIVGTPQYPTSPLFYDNYKAALNCPSSFPTSYYTYKNECDFSFKDVCNNKLVSDAFLANGIKSVGYIYSKGAPSYSTLQTAASQIKNGDNTITGGNSSVSSDLTDWQKAIYLLAEQNGLSYEEMLEQVSLVFNPDGTVTISMADDNTEYNLDSLVTSFNTIYTKVEDISGDLSNLLDYLKSLNVEGLESYIAAIEGTLDQLNERDKDRQAIYDNLSGKLDDISSFLSSLDLDSINSIASDVSEIKEMIKEYSIAVDIDITESISKFETPPSITTKFPFSLPFDIYNIFNIFSANPVAPHFTIPFDFTSIGGEKYDIVIDLSEYDWIANIVRWILYAVFLSGLIILTNKLIGRG